MNIDFLFTDFDRLIQSPESVHRLRRFILDLAVRGKLVPQDPNDEPASELLKRIAVEKVRLVKAKKIPKQAPFYRPDASDVSFDLPSSWAWCPSMYPSYIVSDRGKKIQTKDVVGTGKFPVVDQGKVLIRGYHNDANKVIRIKEPLVLFGDHTREVKLIDFDFVVGADGVKLLQPVSLHTPFYFLALQWLPLKSRGYGRHFKLLKASFIPLPPLAEQHRIVAKVDELMALCGRLEAARAEREAMRDRLATASLARLNAPDPDPATFRHDVAFALNNLAPLTTRPNQIKALRQTILNLAVRGKLVPQDPNDEPASELLKRIAVEKARLIKNREIRKKKPLPPIEKAHEPFPIPPKWSWTPLGNLFHLVTDGTHHTPHYIDKGVPFLSVKDVSSGSVDFSNVRHISEDQHRELCKRCCPEKGDILLTKVGTTGIAVPIKTERSFSIFVSVALLKFSADNLSQDYLFHLLNSPFVRQQSKDNTQGIGNQNLVLRLINGFALPIPPLTEQQRIVAGVDELMALCDRLELDLTTGEETRKRLFESVFYEALEPGREMAIKY